MRIDARQFDLWCRDPDENTSLKRIDYIGERHRGDLRYLLLGDNRIALVSECGLQRRAEYRILARKRDRGDPGAQMLGELGDHVISNRIGGLGRELR